VRDFWTALGLVFVLEGVGYALFPEAMQRIGEEIRNAPPRLLRLMGLVGIGIGWLIVYWARG